MRTLFVAWQEPESRRIHPIARLMRLRSGEYEFAYILAVREAQAHGFSGLPGFEDLGKVYTSRELPALFVERPARRASAETVGMAPAGGAVDALLDAAPITVFVRRGAGEPPQRLEVFAPPLRSAQGSYWGVFEARGVGRMQPPEVIESLRPKERLTLRPEPANAYNPRALVLLRADQTPLGYVPDYFANELAVLGLHDALQVQLSSVRRVTFPPAPPAYRVLCRYTCSAQLGRALFHSPGYAPMADLAEPRVDLDA